MTKQVVTVGLGARAYDIHIGAGLLDMAADIIAPHLHRKRTVIVTDENVAAAQGARLHAGLKASGIAFDEIVLPPGEQTKSFQELEKLAGRLLDLGVERRDLIIAFGGGVIGDLTGFAAAILRRGCRFAQIPTSLLAQVDSAVGGKTAINTVQGKNLIGAFHQPAIVVADIDALNTLPPRELRAGYAEIVKYGAISDAAFFDWLENNGSAVLTGGNAERIRAVKTACETKARIVESDEREQGVRAVLNLGHTFGHAFEAALGFSGALLHGEAVAAGMACAFDYAAAQGLCPLQDAARLKAHLASAGLPAAISDLPVSDNLNADNLVALMLQDKKVSQGQLTLILPKSIGDVVIVREAPIETITTFLKEKTAV